MRMLSRSIPVAGLALCLGAGPLLAQESGSSNFRWYVGGHGGVTFFRTPTQASSEMPVAGGHLLIVAKRTGLLLSLEHGFGDDETSSYDFVVVDSTAGGAVVSGGTVNTTFSGLRKVSAVLMAFPIKNDYLNPYLGLGVGILTTTGNEPDGRTTSALGSTGFGTLIGGLQFRLSRFTAFGQYQITTKPQVDEVVTALGGGRFLHEFGRLTVDGTHTLTAGLRFDLGGAREAVKTGGYQ
jgi:hypothetical protein